jgi:transketolase
MASGSEVSLIVDAAKQLSAEGHGVRVVSFPSWDLFEMQDEAYRESVLPKNLTARLAVEAGSTLGWERYAKSVLGIDHYGASAPYKVIFERSVLRSRMLWHGRRRCCNARESGVIGKFLLCRL